MGAGGYPLMLDAVSLQSAPPFSGVGSTTSVDGMSRMSGADDCSGGYMQSAGPEMMMSAGQLPMAGFPSALGSSAAGFMHGPLSGSLGALPAQHPGPGTLGLPMSPQSQQPMAPPDGLHQAMSMMPQVRPYNMMFGLPGMSEPPMMYDDRVAMPAMHPAAGSWLRIRQPIDYVAPLKKPMNSFLLYSAERRVQLRQTHPDLNTTQQSTILAREWASLAEEEKEKYRAEAKQLRDDYNARRAELSLKLQQQLSQQHLNLSLGHPPPPPLPPGPHSAAHTQPHDLLGQGMGPDGHSHGL
ncbi:hypothetical protein H4R18_003393, partial [Coemansia javaensis]